MTPQNLLVRALIDIQYSRHQMKDIKMLPHNDANTFYWQCLLLEHPMYTHYNISGRHVFLLALNHGTRRNGQWCEGTLVYHYSHRDDRIATSRDVYFFMKDDFLWIEGHRIEDMESIPIDLLREWDLPFVSGSSTKGAK